MKVPLLDLKLQYQSIKNEIEPAMLKVAESQMLILGEEVAQLEKNIASYCQTEFVVAVSSGTDALLMALMAIDLKPGDKVIIPTYSFFATAGVVARLGAIPVFVDSEPITFNIDTIRIREKINSKTKAIIPVHLYGQCANMDELLKTSNEYKIPIIEDCAQAIGAQYKDGKYAGSFGLMGCFSFYPTKNLGAFGEGGIITTNSKELSEKLKQMRNHGMNPKYYHKFIGGNFRLDALQAAVLNVKFPHLENWHQARRDNAILYSKLFIEAGLSEEEGKTSFDINNKVLLPKPVYQNSGQKNYHIYNQFIIRVQERDKLRDFLSKNEIGTEIYYPVPFHRQECFAYLKNNDKDFPIANGLAETTIALPIFPELTKEQIKYVVEKFKEFFS
ncbi:MAG: transcriptional regulator [Ignavibacteria bacterium GWB2_35_12]|nr:MAG: transcriptional regulator [Ignavibacteria bacterium GWA2_35_8]OGU40456.1 MAG: transcriptional regulator [Ignavibacteria bacterium GWB2_35_12]OGV23278.1 MAG: transcriptional regulator [Ignavibacteria bacterium RIFOXYC2_FULL_35_21]